jgi:hypothetical protein
MLPQWSTDYPKKGRKEGRKAKEGRKEGNGRTNGKGRKMKGRKGWGEENGRGKGSIEQLDYVCVYPSFPPYSYMSLLSYPS